MTDLQHFVAHVEESQLPWESQTAQPFFIYLIFIYKASVLVRFLSVLTLRYSNISRSCLGIAVDCAAVLMLEVDNYLSSPGLCGGLLMHITKFDNPVSHTGAGRLYGQYP